jgi:hypothetical protein
MKIKLYTMFAALMFCCDLTFGQDSTAEPAAPASGLSYKVGADLVSSYIFRGTVGSPEPGIQPTMALVFKGLEAGVWGSTDITGAYKELDPYVSFTTKYLKFTFTDYCWNFSGSRYFNYKRIETSHILEGSVGITLPSVPLTVTANTMFYGADMKWDKESESFSTKQNYSTYIEMTYTTGVVTLLAGVTPSNGYYGAGYGKVDGFAVCNLGISAVKTIVITPTFQIPLKGAVIVNPQAEAIHFVIGITL